ncbi:hypothetical protein QQF64_010299 [Cirrhinus molitorella]|uniref:Uncharacterized protein n=1 Tax=Cirrhinus molitorella TaxID=172907 RepID=A0ABR3M778_9TELE
MATGVFIASIGRTSALQPQTRPREDEGLIPSKPEEVDSRLLEHRAPRCAARSRSTTSRTWSPIGEEKLKSEENHALNFFTTER